MGSNEQTVNLRSRTGSSGGSSSNNSQLGTSYSQIKKIEVDAMVDVRLEEKLKSVFEQFQTELLSKMNVNIETQLDKLKDEFNKSITDFKIAISDLQQSANFLSTETSDLKSDLQEAHTRIKFLESAVKDASDLGKRGLDRAREVELSVKNCNIVVYGIQSDDETDDQELVLRTFLSEELGIVDVEKILFRDVFRMGQKKPPVPPATAPLARPMKVQFLCMRDKRQVMGGFLAKRKDFIERGFRLRDDLPLEIRVFRTAAYKRFLKLFKINKTPKFVPEGVLCDKQLFSTIESLDAYVNSVLPATNSTSS